MDDTSNVTTSASAVSRRLSTEGYVKANRNNLTQGGYRCWEWGADINGGVLVKVEYLYIERDMKVRGGPREKALNEARRQRLAEISQYLRGLGYYVSWGWDDRTGDPDTTFIAVASSPVRHEDAEPATLSLRPEDMNQVREQKPDSSEKWREMLISVAEVDESATEVFRAHNAGRDENARRMEHHIYYQVLMAIVGETGENPQELAAAALVTQHLSFPR